LGSADLGGLVEAVAGLQLAHRGFAQGIFVTEDIVGLDAA
jgi:hypothetical protein